MVAMLDVLRSILASCTATAVAAVVHSLLSV